MQDLCIPIVRFFGTDKDAEIEQGSDFHVIILCPGFLIDCGKPVAEYFYIIRVHTVQFQGIGAKSGFRICGSYLVQIFPIFGETPDKDIVLFYFGSFFVQLAFCISLITVICLSFAFQNCQFLVEFCFFQQIVVARKNGHVFAEIASAVFINRPLVNGTGGQITAFKLVDEYLFVMQQVELVTVQRLLHRIDITVHLIAGILLGNDIAFSYSTSVTLFQIGRPSGYIQMVDCNGTLLRIDSRS